MKRSEEHRQRDGEGSRRGPLTGVRVLDLTTMFSGAHGASLLGDFGADVIKVELPGTGDPVRSMAPSKSGVSLTWAVLSRNKRSVTLDIRTSGGRAVLLRLISASDVLFENFRPGTLDRYGLDLATLREANPGIIVIRVSGYGQTGPARDKAGFGTPATAFSGLTYMTGFDDRPPVNQPFPLADYVTGVFSALAAMMALYHRDAAGGSGQEVDLALYESLFRLLETVVPTYDQLGVVAERRGNALSVASPVGTYGTRDGKWVVLTASTDRTYARLTEVMERPDLLTDPRFATNELRVQHNEELNEQIAAWFAQHDRDEVVARLGDSGVPVSPIQSIADIFQDEHYRARGNLISIDHPVLGSVTMPGIVPRFSETPGSVRHAGAHDVGAYNREVYGELLGMSDEEIDQLRAEGVI